MDLILTIIVIGVALLGMSIATLSTESLGFVEVMLKTAFV